MSGEDIAMNSEFRREWTSTYWSHARNCCEDDLIDRFEARTSFGLRGPGFRKEPTISHRAQVTEPSRIGNWPVESGDALYGAYWVAGSVNESGAAGRKVSRGVINEAEIDGKQRRGGQAKSAGGERQIVGGASRYGPPRFPDARVHFPNEEKLLAHNTPGHVVPNGVELTALLPLVNSAITVHNSRLGLDVYVGWDRKKGDVSFFPWRRKGERKEQGRVERRNGHTSTRNRNAVVSRILPGRMKFATHTAHSQSALKHILVRCIHRLAQSQSPQLPVRAPQEDGRIAHPSAMVSACVGGTHGGVLFGLARAVLVSLAAPQHASSSQHKPQYYDFAIAIAIAPTAQEIG
ncbi:hypothetical protein B0H14DRAFT_2618379 [Mycena olivaceomarginata]|nr:hypothetical protein B0H14DRAFT_2618379 [Mycena olivaceomarginata]